MKTYEPRLPKEYRKDKRKLTDEQIEFCKSMRSPNRLMTLKELATMFKVSSHTILMHTNPEVRAKHQKAYVEWMKKNKKKLNIVSTRRKNEKRRMKIKNKLFPKEMKRTRKIKRNLSKITSS